MCPRVILVGWGSDMQALRSSSAWNPQSKALWRILDDGGATALLLLRLALLLRRMLLLLWHLFAA